MLETRQPRCVLSYFDGVFQRSAAWVKYILLVLLQGILVDADNGEGMVSGSSPRY